MLNTNTTPSDMLEMTISEHLRAKVYTALPAQVTKVTSYPDKQMVDVRVMVSEVYPDGKSLNGADLLDVPILFPSGGGGLLSFPIAVGDPVLVVFLKRCLDEWIGGEGDHKVTTLKRQFSLADAVAIPGLYPIKKHLNPDPDNVVLKFAGSSVTLYKNGDVKVDAAKDLIANAVGKITASAGTDIEATANGNINVTAVNTVNITGSSINLVGNVAISGGSLTHEGTNIGDNHKHSGVESGLSNTGNPI